MDSALSGVREGMSGPGALCVHEGDSSGDEPQGARHPQRPGHAGAVSSEAERHQVRSPASPYS